MSARARIHAMFTLDETAETELDKRLDAHAAEAAAVALHAAADEIHRRVPDDERYVVKKTVVNILRRRANTVGEEATAAAVTATPDFFQAERTYQRRRWLFQCLAVAPNPFNGETRAVDFLYRPGDPATATGLDPDDWEHGGWTDVAEADGPDA
jgi:hypothetical protein